MTKTRKDGSRGKLRIDYGDGRDPEPAIRWLWRFIDGGRSAGEVLGRGLVVIAAEQYACRLVVPTSQRSHPTAWASHKNHAAKALAKLAGPHLPASLRQLEKAIARAHAHAQTTTSSRPRDACERPAENTDGAASDEATSAAIEDADAEVDDDAAAEADPADRPAA